MSKVDTQLFSILKEIRIKRNLIPANKSFLLAISGIDSSGKGTIAIKLKNLIETAGLSTAYINIDKWLNLPDLRFNKTDPANHFYKHAIRFDDMFSNLVIPLRESRSIFLETLVTREPENDQFMMTYDFKEIDIIILEGIFLFKKSLLINYNFKVWIDCSFEIALQRAILRGQEGLSKEETIEAYNTIYFPAQHIHLHSDNPSASADFVFNNN